MFRNFKSSGYNLEESKVVGLRLISLIIIITFAYSLATFNVQKIPKIGGQKYVGIIKEYGRTERRHSSFYIGLYSQTWASAVSSAERLDLWMIVGD